MELKEGKVFYEIFKSTDKDWATNITNGEIKSILGDDYSLEFIESVKQKLLDQGIITIKEEQTKVNYTNTRLY
jgi:hypothetical protein